MNYKSNFKDCTAGIEQTSSGLTYINVQGGRGRGDGRGSGGRGDRRGTGGRDYEYYQDQRRSEEEQKKAKADKKRADAAEEKRKAEAAAGTTTQKIKFCRFTGKTLVNVILAKASSLIGGNEGNFHFSFMTFAVIVKIPLS